MAIQEIESKENTGTAGKARSINKAAEGLVMDIAQEQQYTKPIESTVRELTANAVDAQGEKERAIEILTGNVDPSKYFIEREGELYKDSKWDPSYYNLNHLDVTENNVELTYKEGTGIGRVDTFMVKDYGVGIGQGRLEGVLQVGYSTKRNRKDALGAYGLGAKVGLATGSDYYTVTTVYNGVKYKIRVYRRKFNSLIGKFNLETEKENVVYTFSDGYQIYGELTDEKNYTIVEVPVFKHHKQNFVEAVKTQLLYFNNVKFFTEDESGHKEEVRFRADVIYNSKNLIISSNSPYSKPHIVIVKGGDQIDSQTGVCYGYVDFKEMELEDMNGDIGIKCPIRQVMEDEEGNEVVINEGVDVVPSREAVRWTAATREFLKNQFAEAQHEATNLVEKELSQTDFMKWLSACQSLVNKTNSSNLVIGRLARIVEISNLKPKFNKTSLKFEPLPFFFDGFKLVLNTKYLDKKENLHKVNREDLKAWNSLDVRSLYYKDMNANRHHDCYIADRHSGTFVTIVMKTDDQIKADVMSSSSVSISKRDSEIADRVERRDMIMDLMSKSEGFKVYDDIEVPEDYLKNLHKIETNLAGTDKHGASVKPPVITEKERRALEEKVVMNTFTPRYNAYTTPGCQTYQRSKVEEKIEEIADYEGLLYYGYVEDEEKLHVACHLLDDYMVKLGYKNDTFYNKEYKIVLVSKSNKKHFKMHNHINDFFGKLELDYDSNNKIKGTRFVMDNAIVHWNTARKIESKMPELLFLNGFQDIDPDVYEDYTELKKYMDRYHADLKNFSGRYGMDKHYGDFLTFVDKVEKVQEVIENGADPEELSALLKDAKMPGNLTGALVVNQKMINLQDDLLIYAAPVATLLNQVGILTINPGNAITGVLTMSIKEYITWKGATYVKRNREETVPVQSGFETVEEEF